MSFFGLCIYGLSMKLFPKEYVSFVSTVYPFSCLVCIMWCDYGVISMTAPCKPCKLDIIDAVYQKSFEIVYIGAIYVFLVKQLLYFKQKNSK